MLTLSWDNNNFYYYYIIIIEHYIANTGIKSGVYWCDHDMLHNFLTCWKKRKPRASCVLLIFLESPRAATTCSLTHAAPRVVAQPPTSPTATLDLPFSLQHTRVLASAVPQRAGRSICAREKQQDTRKPARLKKTTAERMKRDEGCTAPSIVQYRNTHTESKEAVCGPLHLLSCITCRKPPSCHSWNLLEGQSVAARWWDAASANATPLIVWPAGRV